MKMSGMVRSVYGNRYRLRLEFVEAKKLFEAIWGPTDSDATAGDGADIHVIG